MGRNPPPHAISCPALLPAASYNVSRRRSQRPTAAATATGVPRHHSERATRTLPDTTRPPRHALLHSGAPRGSPFTFTVVPMPCPTYRTSTAASRSRVNEQADLAGRLYDARRLVPAVPAHPSPQGERESRSTSRVEVKHVWCQPWVTRFRALTRRNRRKRRPPAATPPPDNALDQISPWVGGEARARGVSKNPQRFAPTPTRPREGGSD